MTQNEEEQNAAQHIQQSPVKSAMFAQQQQHSARLSSVFSSPKQKSPKKPQITLTQNKATTKCNNTEPSVDQKPDQQFDQQLKVLQKQFSPLQILHEPEPRSVLARSQTDQKTPWLELQQLRSQIQVQNQQLQRQETQIAQLKQRNQLLQSYNQNQQRSQDALVVQLKNHKLVISQQQDHLLELTDQNMQLKSQLNNAQMDQNAHTERVQENFLLDTVQTSKDIQIFEQTSDLETQTEGNDQDELEIAMKSLQTRLDQQINENQELKFDFDFKSGQHEQKLASQKQKIEGLKRKLENVNQQCEDLETENQKMLIQFSLLAREKSELTEELWEMKRDFKTLMLELAFCNAERRKQKQ